MENRTLCIDKRVREPLTRGTRIYRVIYGLGILTLGVILMFRVGVSFSNNLSVMGVGLILIGFFSALYGYIGKKIFSQRIRVDMDNSTMRIRKTLEREVLVDLRAITHLNVLPLTLELSFGDYTKTCDFSLLNQTEFDGMVNHIKSAMEKQKA
ncbi:hypothetical protein CYCD_21670 [Tenuifilaceae bacterium CYCD]|nr:hypothetical protein CYCD_21670 [Tenuifilaceae bacterium CYCD]